MNMDLKEIRHQFTNKKSFQKILYPLLQFSVGLQVSNLPRGKGSLLKNQLSKAENDLVEEGLTLGKRSGPLVHF